MPAQGVLRILLIVIVCNTVLIHQASASDTQQQVLKGAYIEFPPLSYTDDQGEPAGSYLEYAEALADRAGYDIDWRSLPLDRIYLYLREGRLDVWMGSEGVPALAESTLEPNFTFPPIRLHAYHLEETEPVSGMEELRGEDLILIRGYTYLGRLAPVKKAEGTQVGQASTHVAALRMLEAGRGDYLLDFQAPVEEALEKQPIPDITHSPITSWNTTLVFSAQAEGVKELIRDFEKAHSSLEHPLRR
ncbi:MAG: substrate-binding periplasmic protein [Pseudomonadota bacterium]